MIKPSDEIFSPYHIHRHYEYSGPFNHVIPVAEHYGFKVIKPIKSKVATVDSKNYIAPEFETKLSAVEHYLENIDTYSSPALLCHTKNARNKQAYINLDAYGVEDAFVETLLVKSAYEILQREGRKNLLVEINSFGSTESFERFSGEVEKFAFKHHSKFPPAIQKLIKESVFNLYNADLEENEELSANHQELLLHRPRSIACLSELCRNHLKELLEHLEESGIPYHLNPYLFPQSGKHAETVYKIVDQDSGAVAAYGERFTTQASKALRARTGGNLVHCAAITISVTGGKTERYKAASIETTDTVKDVYFAYSGAIAKKNALKILSMLHESGISVKHSVIKRTLREQLYHAEKSNFPLTLILGVKEVQDGTILVRNNEANRQKAVSLNRMCAYIKRYL